MKKLFLFLTLLLSMEAAFPSVTSLPSSEQSSYVESNVSANNSREFYEIRRDLDVINSNVKSVEDTVKFHWRIYWGLTIFSSLLMMMMAAAS